MRLSAARSAFLAPKARAISRVPTLPLRSRMKATSSSREGRRFMGHAWPDRPSYRPRARPIALSRGSRNIVIIRQLASSCGFCAAGGLRGRAAGFLPAALIWSRRAGRRPLGLARPRMRRRRVALRPGVDQRDGLLERDGLGRLVGRQRRIDAVVADIGTVAALLGHDRAALGRVIAERAARIGAEAALARTLGDLFGDQRHRAIEADGEDLLRGIEIGVGLAVLDVGSETADAGADRLAVLGVAADFARQRQERERALEIDLVGRRCLSAGRRASASRRLVSLAELQIGAEAAAAHRDVEAGCRIHAELFGADVGRAVGRRRQRRAYSGIRDNSSSR